MAQWLNWGDGSDGSPNAISGTINTYATCTGTAGQTSLTTALSASAGDQILIHQSQGTGAGTWEICKVVSDAGATLNLATALANSYSTGAQAVLIPQYTGGTISGAVTGTAWNGAIGGIIALLSNGDLTVSGSLKVNGVAGTESLSAVAGASGGGFRGGDSRHANAPQQAIQGEGYTGYGSGSTSANGNGGGGGYMQNNTMGSGGGGGSNGNYGVSGTYEGAGGVAGTRGGLSGNAELTSMVFGGGGGGGCKDGNGSESSSSGSSGGGIIIIIAKNITISGTIEVIGGVQKKARWNESSGGAGAGGSILIKTQIAILGTNKLVGSGGASTAGGYGAGGAGRIRCDYFTSVSGSTTPTLSSAQDLTLNVSGGSNFFAFF